MVNSSIPSKISLHKKSNVLELCYGYNKHSLPSEYLRVYSPSAEVRGHSHGQAILQTDKQLVRINKIEAIGHYALKIYFDDGHDSGLFTWDYLYKLATERNIYWKDYLNRLEQAGYLR